jgi:hypothetical protein
VAGDKMPTDLGRRAAYAREHADAERAVFQAARDQLTESVAGARRGGVNLAIPALRPHLDALMDEARGLAPTVAGIANAQQALDSGSDTAVAWQRFGRLADDYRRLRAAQVGITKLRHPGVHVERYLFNDLWLISGELSNTPEVWSGWRDGGTPPWPHDPSRPRVIEHGRAYLLWVASHETAVPWVPTTDELLANFEAAQNASADPDRPRPVQHLTPSAAPSF